MELVFGWIVLGVVVAMIAASKGRSAFLWFLYGALVWPIALVHILLTPRPTAVADAQVLAGGEHRKCPFCAELVRTEAIVCKHCGRDIGPERQAVEPPPPEPPAGPIAVGSRVVNARYGAGSVTEIGPLAVTVAFDQSGVQLVPRSSLRLIVEG